MKRFLITNTNFTGEAELVYNAEDLLIIIDCSNTNMNAAMVKHFKTAAPISPADLQSSFSANTVIVEAGYEVTFDAFYKAYPLKRNRYKAEKLWSKMAETDRVKAFFSLTGYKKFLKAKEWQTPMIADSYLSRKEYETEWTKIAK